MKTKIILFAVLLAIVGNSANAQFLSLANNNSRLTIGFQLGETGWHTDYAGLGWGVSASICGFYADFLLRGPQHRYDKHVNQDIWHDDEAYTINVGYQIPITSWLRIAPIIGYSQTNYGITDMSTVNIERGEYSSSIYHDYYIQKRFHEFNYGAGLFLQPFRYIELYGVYTARSIYGGISLNLTALADKKWAEYQP